MPNSGLDVLIDFDNLLNLDKRRGAEHVIYKVLSLLSAQIRIPGRVAVRLYGGWYEATSLSRRAQALAAEVQQEFPKPMAFAKEEEAYVVLTRAELAYSLVIDPTVPLGHTYRLRGVPEGLECTPTPFARCMAPTACPIAPMRAFLQEGSCPVFACAVSTADVLRRAEQKLVDTMLTSDLIYLARNPGVEICVVTADDDMWPGVRSALLLGAAIYHVTPKPIGAAVKQQRRAAGSNYFHFPLS